MKGPPPITLVRRLEKAIADKPLDDIVFSLCFVLGRFIGTRFPPHNHDAVLHACLDTIRNATQDDAC